MKLAVDIGGTHIRYTSAVNDVWGEVRDIKWQGVGLEWLFDMLLDSHPDTKEVGISFAGQVCEGVVLSAPNIKQDAPLDVVNYFGAKNVRACINNDLKCAALAESAYFGKKNIFVIYVGTGFGAAFVTSKGILHGNSNLAGEVGHIPYKKAPFTCGCGKDNCVELFCSGSGLKRQREYYKLEALDTLKKLESSSDMNALKIVDNFKEALLFGTGAGVAMYNPSLIVFGGGVVDKNPELVEFVKNNISKYAPTFGLKNLTIIRSEIEEGALEGAKELLSQGA